MKSDILEIYADGAELLLGSSLSKLNFYSVVDVNESDGIKQTDKKLKVQIAIPTISLLGLCAKVLTNTKSDEKEIIDMIDNDKKEFIKILGKLSIVDDTEK